MALMYQLILADYGPPVGAILVIAIPIIILGLIREKVRTKKINSGEIRGPDKSKDILDGIFYHRD